MLPILRKPIHCLYHKIEIFNTAAKKILQCETHFTIDKLKSKHPQFTNFILKLKNNEQKTIKLDIQNSYHSITAKCVIFTIKERPIRFISFQDISNELAFEELEAWQKLIRVLRHEIMNSVTPIKSLTSTIIRIFSKNGQSKKIEQIKQENIDNALAGLLAIDKRNQGMSTFIESYRNLTNTPKPVFEEVNINEFFDHIKILMNEDFKLKHVEVEFLVQTSNIKIQADEKLLSQLMINLLRNAIEAMKTQQKKMVHINASLNTNKQMIISVKDNGSGIDKDELDNIFVPFYTSKEKGSGIGLSLCQQIMHLHKGRISVTSKKGEGSTFTLEF